MMITQLGKSLVYAGRGLRYAFSHEQNFRVQCLFAVLALLAGAVFHLRTFEFLAVLFLILLVLILELLNSALEKFVDLLKPRLTIQIEIVKNIMAAMVLLASLGSLVIGAIIFWPHVVEFVLSL